MTDTTTFGAAEQPAPNTGTLQHLPPQEIELDTNVRDGAALDAQFVASIREHGVLQPVTAFQTPDGTIKVRNGSLSSSRVVVDPCGAAECCRGCDRTR